MRLAVFEALHVQRSRSYRLSNKRLEDSERALFSAKPTSVSRHERMSANDAASPSSTLRTLHACSLLDEYKLINSTSITSLHCYHHHHLCSLLVATLFVHGVAMIWFRGVLPASLDGRVCFWIKIASIGGRIFPEIERNFNGGGCVSGENFFDLVKNFLSGKLISKKTFEFRETKNINFQKYQF